MPGPGKIFVIIFLIAIVGGAIYYFGFMRGPEVEYTPPAAIGRILPQIDIGVLESPLFKALKSHKALPISPDKVGNPVPFNKIDFLPPPAPPPGEGQAIIIE